MEKFAGAVSSLRGNEEYRAELECKQFLPLLQNLSQLLEQHYNYKLTNFQFSLRRQSNNKRS